MLIRALIVLLVFLNLGVAGWWLTRGTPVLPAPAQPRDVALLALTRVQPVLPKGAPASAGPRPETSSAIAPQPAAPEPRAAAPSPPKPPEPVAAATPVALPARAPDPVPAPAPAPQCLALGPFDDQVAARSAQARLVPAPRNASVRSEILPAKAYSVLLSPLADRAAAQAAVERITAAGFDDMMVINSGPSINGVALGRYGSREAAQRRQAELRAGGFNAQLQPVGQDTQWWLDVTLGPGEAAVVRRQAQAARALPRDCG
jgi:cell division protein FtsN